MTILKDKRRFWSPVVSRIDFEGRPAVLKDYRTKSLLGPLASVMIRREFRILQRLEGVAGIPRAYRILDRRALVTEFVEGRTIGKFRPGDLDDAVFRRLGRVVREMHARGVVHLDLRQKKNIVITPDGRPYLVDFASALVREGPFRAIWELLLRVDRGALLKFKERNFPHLVTDEDRAELARHRFLRKFWIFTPRGRHVR